jgi:hypothetical protein
VMIAKLKKRQCYDLCICQPNGGQGTCHKSIFKVEHSKCGKL